MNTYVHLLGMSRTSVWLTVNHVIVETFFRTNAALEIYKTYVNGNLAFNDNFFKSIIVIDMCYMGNGHCYRQ